MHTFLRLMAVLCLLATSACMSIAGDMDGISPSQFKFVSVVPHQGEGPGGWKAARLIITLVRSLTQPETVTCYVSVEVPEVNEQGVVTDGFAQRMSARAADAAAARVAGQGYFSAEMCKRFRDEMQRELRLLVSGSRIKEFIL
ncbi:MAG TPA: hypothetical protein VEZ71_09715 [Archangium sp.]|nr:hypothetical protein [Archangium sp.]